VNTGNSKEKLETHGKINSQLFYVGQHRRSSLWLANSNLDMQKRPAN